MEAIIRFLQDTGFYLFTQDGNWRCLVMIGIACVLLYLGIVKKFEPLLLVPIAFGMLITNLPGANMFHEIFFAGGHIHWDIIGGKPITAELLSELYNQGVAENVLSPYLQQLMTAAQTMFSPEAVSSTIAEITASATDGISAFGAQLEALVQAEQAASYYGMTLSDVTVSAGLVDILYLGVKLGIYPCLIFMGVGAMTDFGPLIANPKSLLLGVVAFSFGTAGGVLLAKFMNLFLKEKINPLIGSAGVSAVPMAARVSQMVGQKYNPGNFLLMHAMGPNVAGVIGSAIAAGVLISLFG